MSGKVTSAASAAVAASDAPAVLFPVGHYQGPLYLAGSDRPVGYRVRLGPSLRWLGSGPELWAWTLAHGFGEITEDELPTRDTLAMQASQLANVDVAEAITRLVDRSLLVPVDLAGDETTDFARAHRLRPLMLTLGRDQEEPDVVMLGIAGQPVAALSGLGHAVWLAGQHAPSLWDAWDVVAGADPAITNAAALLPELLGELHGLVGAGIAYLDAAEGESC